jgi:hypothetical protein
VANSLASPGPARMLNDYVNISNGKAICPAALMKEMWVVIETKKNFIVMTD